MKFDTSLNRLSIDAGNFSIATNVTLKLTPTDNYGLVGDPDIFKFIIKPNNLPDYTSNPDL